jgi:hypothetical protein
MDYGINPQQLAALVIRPALTYIGMHSRAAEQLVLGTALTESRGEYVKQLGKGPALGLWQMEPATHDDILGNFVAYKPQLRGWLTGLTTSAKITDGALELVGNLFYGAAMCRIHYARVRATLPLADEFGDMALYWKRWYNTPLGAGTADKALPHFYAACQAVPA